MSKEHRPNSPRPPYRAVWEITRRCDLSCDSCLVEAGSATHELDTRQALSVVDQLAAVGVRVVTLTGGEPFLRRDWAEIAGRVRGKGMELRFSTNGHLVRGEVLRTLVELGATTVAVSVDGTRATHDRIRGARERSSHDRVMEAIDRLVTTPIRAHAITTVTRRNLAELPHIHRQLKERRVQGWMIQLGHRTGRARRSCSATILSPEDLLLRARNRGTPPGFQGCHGGLKSFGITPWGGVKGCTALPDAFATASLRRRALDEIWADDSCFPYTRLWSRSTLSGPCAGCVDGDLCRAGCPAHAYTSTGTIGFNPYCLKLGRRG